MVDSDYNGIKTELRCKCWQNFTCMKPRKSICYHDDEASINCEIRRSNGQYKRN